MDFSSFSRLHITGNSSGLALAHDPPHGGFCSGVLLGNGEGPAALYPLPLKCTFCSFSDTYSFYKKGVYKMTH